MDGLNDLISNIMQDEESVKKLQDMAASLGISSESPAAASVDPAPGGAVPELSPEMMGTLVQLMGKMREDNDSIRLLKALRPLLSPSRQQKLDGAVKINRLFSLLPLLKESDLLSRLL